MRQTLMTMLLISACFTAHAEDTTTDQSDSDLPTWADERLTPFHEDVSNWVETTSRRIDSFFGTTDAFTVETDSYLRISAGGEWRQGQAFDDDWGARFRLDLPTSEERLRLIIESEPEETRGTLGEQDASLPNDRPDGLESLQIGLNRLGNRDKTKRWKTEVGAGVRLHLPLDPYTRVTTQRLWTLDDGPWQLESDNRLSWFNNDGFSARTRWDLGRPLDDSRHLRFITNVQWREEVDNLEYSETVELNHRLNRRSALRHSLGLIGESGSHPRLEDAYLQTRYRRDVHKGILFLDVAPSLHFPREHDHDPRWQMNLRLEMYFRRHFDRAVF
ncbi:hypothetical protein OM427_16090 [Halomonas sp. 18H]|uniref:hypothetical protein n=1 Tax=Halomonas almeriensis TaxID=308163 RepID=UPI00222E4F77|nr:MULTISPECIES: hypothetical protein [Halomonas]MCW4151053.1 hypothetical protein [Halomonas sp. 18H]MDN3552933.1 hypothetical protein [Halomonas almeriensis]